MPKKIKVDVLPPRDYTYIELLRFWCQTAHADDPSLPFMASMWSYALANNSLTGRQARSANVYINYRMRELGLEEVDFNDK